MEDKMCMQMIRLEVMKWKVIAKKIMDGFTLSMSYEPNVHFIMKSLKYIVSLLYQDKKNCKDNLGIIWYIII